MHIYPTAGSMYFTNCTFVGNTGHQGGAVSLWDVALVVIASCRFENNSAINSYGLPGDGAALYVDGYTARDTALFIKNSTFLANNGSGASGSGAVTASQCQCIGIIDSNFENNLGIALSIELTQGDCEGSYVNAYPPLFNLSTIAGNEDTYLNQYTQDTVLGGSTSVDIRNTTFKGNVDSTFLQGVDTEAAASALRGGAGLNIQSTQRIVLTDLRFDGNQAWQGGALLLDSCFAIVIWSSTFTHNFATKGGGPVASVDNAHLGGLFIGNTSVVDNTALTGGGVCGADQASIIIGNGTVFDGNEAAANGGAFACLECASLTVQDQVAMQTNYANASGGALYVDSLPAIQSTNTKYFGNRYDQLCLTDCVSHQSIVKLKPCLSYMMWFANVT
jgi:predicted outer membrane repeat protein